MKFWETWAVFLKIKHLINKLENSEALEVEIKQLFYIKQRKSNLSVQLYWKALKY